LLLWFLFLYITASLIIFIKWLNYPITSPYEIPYDEFLSMNYWYNRIWYYSIIPLSIFASIGLIKLRESFNRCYLIKNIKKKIILIINSLTTGLLIFLVLSNTIITALYYYNIDWKIKDDEAQAIGWISMNIPHNSQILIDRNSLFYHLDDIALCKTSFIDNEIYEALKNYEERLKFSFKNIRVTKELYEHNKVVVFNNSRNELYSNLIITKIEQEFGFLEFFIRTNNGSRSFWMYGSDEGEVIFDFSLNAESFCIYNGTDYQKIITLENNKWYLYKLYFECTINNNFGLKQYFWKINVNGTEYGEFNFNNNLSKVSSLSFYTDGLDFEYQVFISNLNFSWIPDFNVLEHIFDKLNVIREYLKSNYFQYYLYSRYDTYYKKRAENYIEIEGLLLPFFYNKTLFEYGNLVLFCTNETR